eukprot:s819_g10.t1
MAPAFNWIRALTTRLWSKRATLEYLDLVDLRHVYERSDRLAFQRLDIFLDLAEFGLAFKEAVSEQTQRLHVLAEAGEPKPAEHG